MSSRPRTHERLETREVVVEDPALSPEVNRTLTDEVKDAVGADTVEVPADRPHPSRGGDAVKRGLAARASANTLMLVTGLFSVLVIGAIVAATTRHWWIMAIAVVIDIVGIAATAGNVVGMTTHMERPHPTTVAAMEEQGMHNAEERFSEMVDEFTPEPASEHGHRTASAARDGARAGAEQSSATTPSGGPSRPVGPGGD